MVLALAVIDDVGAILVIAMFYSSGFATFGIPFRPDRVRRPQTALMHRLPFLHPTSQPHAVLRVGWGERSTPRQPFLRRYSDSQTYSRADGQLESYQPA
jgi:hypothetical protein